MEEDRLAIVQRLLGMFREDGDHVSVHIYSDFSGHLEDGDYKRINNSEFFGPDDLVATLARAYNRRKEKKEYAGNIFTRFWKGKSK